jgi:hypothetical protein
MTSFKRLVLKSELQITLYELAKAGAQNVTCVERSDDQVEVTATLPTAPTSKPGNMRIGKLRFGHIIPPSDDKT